MIAWRESAKGNMWAQVGDSLVVVFSSSQAGPVRYYFSIDTLVQVGEFTSQEQAMRAVAKALAK